jgi:hypothetical protein
MAFRHQFSDAFFAKELCESFPICEGFPVRSRTFSAAAKIFPAWFPAGPAQGVLSKPLLPLAKSSFRMARLPSVFSKSLQNVPAPRETAFAGQRLLAGISWA